MINFDDVTKENINSATGMYEIFCVGPQEEQIMLPA